MTQSRWLIDITVQNVNEIQSSWLRLITDMPKMREKPTTTWDIDGIILSQIGGLMSRGESLPANGGTSSSLV